MKRLFAICLFAGSVLGLTAEPITPTQALSRVKNNSSARKIAAKHVASPKLIAELPELYVFSSGNGFMILPADDVAQPLLGYADSGEFDPEQIPALKWWLSTYSEQISRAADAGVSVQNDASATERKPIEPLLTTTWNQDAPYNNLAPEYSGRKCYTGCVATAMAQVMNYHKWPAKGQGEITYAWSTNNDQQLSMDFSEVTFDWDNMEDSYSTTTTAEQDLAVATLMKACGYSVQMDYSTIGSGANPVLIGGALIEYFNYDQGIWQPQRDFYEQEEWDDLIYSELAAKRPVIYGGSSAEGGHQFVCDGYSSDGFFHFNWGWGGMSDGYFKLNALNPGSQGIGGFVGGYNMNQSVTIGVQPPVEGSKPVYMLGSSNEFKPTNESVQLGGFAIFNCMVSNIGASVIPSQSEIDIELTPSEGSDPIYVKCINTAQLEPNLGYPTLYAQFPTTLPEGTYTARLVFKVPDGEWQPVWFPRSIISELTATVEGTKITFAAKNEPGITITDLPEDKTIYNGTRFVIPMTLTNKTDTEYTGSMFPRIIPIDTDDEVGYGTNTPVQLSGSQALPFEYVGTFYAKGGGTIAPGSYRLLFISQQNNKPLCDPIPITIAEKPANTKYEVTDLTFIGMQPGDIAKFTMKVTCTEGYLDDYFLLVITNASSNSDVVRKRVDVLLTQGESEEVTCEIDMSEYDYGNYYATAYDYGAITPRVNFSYAKYTTTIDEVTSSSGDAQIYDLQGRRVSKPASGHIYIRSGKLIRF